MPNSSKQSGMAPIAIIIAVVVIIAAAGGYFLLNKGGGVTIPSLPGGVALNPVCKFNDADLCKFINNFKITNNFSAKSITSDKTGAKSESTFESVGTDKTHMVLAEAGKEGFNVITIGDTTYTKDYADNKWWKQVTPKVTGTPEPSNIKDIITETDTPEDKTTYKKIGMEACGSRQCFKYQIIDPTITDSTEYIWFDNSEYLLRRQRSESKDGSVIDTEMNYSGINISVPNPIKDAKPDQIIMPFGGTIPGMDSGQQTQGLENAPLQVVDTSSPDEAAPTDTFVDTSVDTSGENQ
jgi:hypothetical protein